MFNEETLMHRMPPVMALVALAACGDGPTATGLPTAVPLPRRRPRSAAAPVRWEHRARGENQSGQLSDGTITASEQPVEVQLQQS